MTLRLPLVRVLVCVDVPVCGCDGAYVVWCDVMLCCDEGEDGVVETHARTTASRVQTRANVKGGPRDCATRWNCECRRERPSRGRLALSQGNALPARLCVAMGLYGVA